MAKEKTKLLAETAISRRLNVPIKLPAGIGHQKINAEAREKERKIPINAAQLAD